MTASSKTNDATGGNTVADAREVIATLQDLFRAYMTKDLVTVDRIYHHALSHGHSSGVVDTKPTVMADVARRYWHIEFKGEAHVEGTMAYVRSVMNFRVGTTPEMTTYKPDMRLLWVLIKTEHGWQVIASQALPARHLTPVSGLVSATLPVVPELSATPERKEN